MTNPTALAVTAAVALCACAGLTSVYTLPVSNLEGEALVPALIISSQTLGLRAFRGPNGAIAEMVDGTQLSWQPSENHRGFILLLVLPPNANVARQSRLDDAKAIADQVWELAVATQVHRGPRPLAQQSAPGVSFSMNTSEPAAPTNAQQGCRVDFDCASGSICRNRGDGYSVCMHNGRAGDFCASSNDCVLGLNCRSTGTVNTCQR